MNKNLIKLKKNYVYMEYKNLIPIFKKVKPLLNFNKQDIFKRKIKKKKNNIKINNIINKII